MKDVKGLILDENVGIHYILLIFIWPIVENYNVHTTRILTYVWLFFNMMREMANYHMFLTNIATCIIIQNEIILTFRIGSVNSLT